MMQLRKNRRYTSSMFLAKGDNVNNDICLKLLGEFRSFGAFEYEQISPTCSIHIIHEGSGIFSAGNKNYAAKQGDIFCFFPGMRIHYFDTMETPWFYHWLSLCGEKYIDILQQTGLSADSPFLTLSNYPEVEHFISDLKTELLKNQYSIFYPVKAA